MNTDERTLQNRVLACSNKPCPAGQQNVAFRSITPDNWMDLRKRSRYLVLKWRISPSKPLFSPDYGWSEVGSLLLFSGHERTEMVFKLQPKKKKKDLLELLCLLVLFSADVCTSTTKQATIFKAQWHFRDTVLELPYSLYTRIFNYILRYLLHKTIPFSTWSCVHP